MLLLFCSNNTNAYHRVSRSAKSDRTSGVDAASEIPCLMRRGTHTHPPSDITSRYPNHQNPQSPKVDRRLGQIAPGLGNLKKTRWISVNPSPARCMHRPSKRQKYRRNSKQSSAKALLPEASRLANMRTQIKSRTSFKLTNSHSPVLTEEL
jgi:hypothetical protein